MPDFISISKNKYTGLGWMPAKDYRFAARENMVPLVIDEVSYAMPTLPLAFRGRKDETGKLSYALVALLSPIEDSNLFVKPDGSWLSGYVPAYLRAYPFRIFTSSDTGQKIVCFDQDSGLTTEKNTQGSQAFFAENGEPSPHLAEVMKFLQNFEQRRMLTQTAVNSLAELGLIVPWRIVLDSDGKKKPVPGLFKVNAQALQKLAAEPLHKLHQCGALTIAYAQLSSEPRMQTFSELLQVQGKLRKEKAESVTLGNIEALFGSQSDLLNFDNF